MENTGFITTEDADDLIVSFVIPVDEHGDVKSLILLRTPKYEFALDKSERGVKVSFEDFPERNDELLEQLLIEGDVVTIITNYRTYKLSIKDVEEAEIEQAKILLGRMNYDGRFRLKIN